MAHPSESNGTVGAEAPQYDMEAQVIKLIPYPPEATNGSAKLAQEPQASCPAAVPSPASTETPMQRLERQVAQPCERVGILVELAGYKLASGRIEQAIELLERAIRCHSQAVEPVLLLGKAWEEEGEYEKALEIYMEALQRGVASAAIEEALFRPDFLLSTYPRSITELSIVAARKKSGLMLRLLARACEVNTDYEKALTFLTEAVGIDPRDIAALSMLARIAEKRQQMEEAALWHRRILEINPSLPVSNLFLALRHFAQREYAAALPHLARLRMKDRQNRMYQLSWLLAHLHVSGIDGLEQQLEEVRQWQDLTPEEQALAQELFLVAGEHSLEEGRTRAEQYILHALHLAPSSSGAASGAALLAETDQRVTERTVYQKVLEMVGDEDKPAGESDPTIPLISFPKDLRWSPEKGWQKRYAWMRTVLPWFTSRIGGGSAADDNHRK